MSGTRVTPAVRTLGALVLEARTLLQDKVPTVGGVTRYSDDEIYEALNGAMVEARARRPDLFLGSAMGLRLAPGYYSAETDASTAFPLDPQVYSTFLYYIVGRCELREDTFTNDSRAVTLMNKFTSGLLQAAS